MRWIRRGLLCLATLPLIYLLAALAGALIPANLGWSPPTRGVQLYILSNGVHTAIVMPVRAAGIDWGQLIHPSHLQRPDLAGDHLAVAWGQREFYLTTPEWSDLRAGVALRALAGRGGTLMHVYHLRAPRPAPDQRPLLVTEDQYRRIAGFILTSFRLTEGALVPLPGYEDTDSFYEARGRYSLFRTSNEWTGTTLRHAGVRVGIWTPFAQSLMWRFPVKA